LNFFGAGTSASLALTNVEHLTSGGGVGTVSLSNGSVGLTSIDLGMGIHTLNLGPGDHNLSAANVFTLNSFGINNDTINFDVGPAAGPSVIATVNQTVNLGAGNDVLNLTGANNLLDMSISGGSANPDGSLSLTVHDNTASGNVDLTLLNQQAGALYDLGAGTDTLRLTWDQNPNHFNVVSVQNVENVVGTMNSDQIHLLGNSAGATSVTGGGGADLIWAGPTEDHFVYTSIGDSPATLGASGRDVITGFDASNDLFDLRGLDVTNWHASTVGGHTVVDIFAGGHANPDMQIQLSGFSGTLDSHNFLLV
jgi:hypothetical protein